MPELPEVEAARALAERWCRGKTIVKATVQQDEKVVEGIACDELQKNLIGKRVTGAGRKAKHLWLEMGEGGVPALYLHFGMTGSIIVKSPSGALTAAKYERIDPDLSGAWPPRFTKLDFELDDGTCLAFTDSRRFAKVKWLTEPARTVEPVSRLAPDALTEMPTLQDFETAIKGMSRKKALKIKALLLDQEGLVSGVGNWVADEVLYQAKVHPEQTVLSLSPEQLAAIHSSLCSVIKHSVSVDADSARFPATWLFHYRWTGKKATVDANGQVIEFVTVGSRTSAFVPALQKLTETTVEVTTTTTKRARKVASGAKPKKKKGRGAAGTGDADDDGGSDANGSASEGDDDAEEREQGTGAKAADAAEVKAPPKGGRGRKQRQAAEAAVTDDGAKAAPAGNKRRGKKAEEVKEEDGEKPAPAAKRRRGGAKAAPAAAAASKEEEEGVEAVPGGKQEPQEEEAGRPAKRARGARATSASNGRSNRRNGGKAAA